MRLIPELMQFDRGMSMILYLPAKPTAGLARLSVSGYSRVPRPPPRIIAVTPSMLYYTRSASYLFHSRTVNLSLKKEGG